MDITQITPNLYVGSNPTRSDAQAIARRGITHVVDLRGEPTANGPAEHAEPEIWTGTGVQYQYVPMRDNGTRIPAAKYGTAVSLIESAIRAGGKVLVHCSAGRYRSPSVAYAYLRKTGLSPDAAWSLVARRPGANRQYIDDANRYLAGIGISGGTLVTGTAPGSTATTGKTPTTGPLPPTSPKPDESGSNIGLWLAGLSLLAGVAYLATQPAARHNPIEGELRADRAVYRATLRSGRIADIFRLHKSLDGYVYEFVWYLPPGTTKLPARAGSDYRNTDTPVELPDYLAAERLFNGLRPEPRANPSAVRTVDPAALPAALRPYASKIVDAYRERDGEDLSWWVHLHPDWCFEPDAHTIHESTLKAVVRVLRDVAPCKEFL